MIAANWVYVGTSSGDSQVFCAMIRKPGVDALGGCLSGSSNQTESGEPRLRGSEGVGWDPEVEPILDEADHKAGAREWLLRQTQSREDLAAALTAVLVDIARPARSD